MGTRIRKSLLPSSISNLIVWLDASDYSTLYLSGTNVTRWNSRVNGTHYSQGTAANQPTYSSTTKSVTLGSDDYMTHSGGSTLSTNPGTVIAVIRDVLLGQTSNILLINGGFSAGVNYLDLVTFNIQNYLGYSRYATSDYASSIQTPLSGTSIVAWTKVAASTDVNVYQYGKSSISSATLSTSTTANVIPYGTLGFSSLSANCGICEILVYNKVLTDNEKSGIVGYLQNKWNVPLNPRSISGLVRWYDAVDDATFVYGSGLRVSTWADKSPYEKNANQGTAGLMPLRVLNAYNGLPTVRFVASGTDYLTYDGSTSWIGASNYSVFVVTARNSSTVPNNFIGGADAVTNRQLALGWNTNTAIRHSQYANNYSLDVKGYSSTELFLLEFTHNTVDGKIIYVNGLSLATTTDVASLSTPTANANYIGRSNNAGSYSYFDGDICEILMYNSTLSDSNRYLVEHYLKRKWGLGGTSI